MRWRQFAPCAALLLLPWVLLIPNRYVGGLGPYGALKVHGAVYWSTVTSAIVLVAASAALLLGLIWPNPFYPPLPGARKRVVLLFGPLLIAAALTWKEAILMAPMIYQYEDERLVTAFADVRPGMTLGQARHAARDRFFGDNIDLSQHEGTLVLAYPGIQRSTRIELKADPSPEFTARRVRRVQLVVDDRVTASK